MKSVGLAGNLCALALVTFLLTSCRPPVEGGQPAAMPDDDKDLFIGGQLGAEDSKDLVIVKAYGTAIEKIKAALKAAIIEHNNAVSKAATDENTRLADVAFRASVQNIKNVKINADAVSAVNKNLCGKPKSCTCNSGPHFNNAVAGFCRANMSCAKKWVPTTLSTTLNQEKWVGGFIDQNTFPVTPVKGDGGKKNINEWLTDVISILDKCLGPVPPLKRHVACYDPTFDSSVAAAADHLNGILPTSQTCPEYECTCALTGADKNVWAGCGGYQCTPTVSPK